MRVSVRGKVMIGALLAGIILAFTSWLVEYVDVAIAVLTFYILGIALGFYNFNIRCPHCQKRMFLRFYNPFSLLKFLIIGRGFNCPVCNQDLSETGQRDGVQH